MVFKKYIKNKKGMTLIELILAMAIFGIIVSSFLTMFTAAFMGTVQAGHKAKAAYEAQESLVDDILDPAATYVQTKNLNYNFSGGPNLSIPIGVLESEETVRDVPSKMTSFRHNN